MKNQLKEERRKYNILFNKNNILKEINKKLNEEIIKLKQYKEENDLLKAEIDKKNIEIQKYQSTDIDIDIKRGIASIKPGEIVISVNFVSQGNQDIVNFSLPCKNTDLFVTLKERLYNEFPKYNNNKTFFMVNTIKVDESKTLDENKIKNGNVINVFNTSNK